MDVNSIIEVQMNFEEGHGTTIRLAVLEESQNTGDLDCDSTIDTNDRSVLRSALGTSAGQAGFNADADYDGDRSITCADYRIWYGLFKSF